MSLRNISHYVQDEKEAKYYTASTSIRYCKIKILSSKSTCFEMYDEGNNFLLAACCENSLSKEFIFVNKRNLHLQYYSALKSDLCNMYCASYLGRLQMSFSGKIVI